MGLERGNGVQQWIFQRFSNIIILVFIAVLATAMLSELSYEALSTLLAQTWFKVYLTITLIFASLNSILAGWQIAGDYAQKISLPNWIFTGFGVLVTMVYFITALLLIY
jgi:succinate dehydrogenase hydrophobic membrane anchor protein